MSLSGIFKKAAHEADNDDLTGEESESISTPLERTIGYLSQLLGESPEGGTMGLPWSGEDFHSLRRFTTKSVDEKGREITSTLSITPPYFPEGVGFKDSDARRFTIFKNSESVSRFKEKIVTKSRSRRKFTNGLDIHLEVETGLGSHKNSKIQETLARIVGVNVDGTLILVNPEWIQGKDGKEEDDKLSVFIEPGSEEYEEITMFLFQLAEEEKKERADISQKIWLDNKRNEVPEENVWF